MSSSSLHYHFCRVTTVICAFLGVMMCSTNMSAQLSCTAGFDTKEVNWSDIDYVEGENITLEGLDVTITKSGSFFILDDNNSFTGATYGGFGAESMESLQGATKSDGEHRVTISFSQPVYNLSFSIFDVDANDEYKLSGSPEITAVTNTPDFTIDGVDVKGNGNNSNNANGTVNVQFVDAITEMTIIISPSATFGLSNLTMCTEIPDPEPEYVAVGDLLFIDKNEDQVYSTGDSVLSDVTVELYQLDKSVGTPNVEIFKTTVTDENGQYQFDSLPAGEYVLYIPSSELEKSKLKGLKLIEGSGDLVTDNDDNGQDDLLLGGVVSSVIDLQPNKMPKGEQQSGYQGGLDDDNVNFTIDFGFYREEIVPEPLYVAIGDKIYLDVDGDGLYGTGDKGIEGVRVELYTSDLSPGVSDPLAVTITDPTGYYVFDTIEPADYLVYIPSSEFEEGKPLYQKESVKNTVTTDPIDNDDNGQDNTLRGGIASLFITLESDKAPVDEDQSNYKGALTDENVDFTIDFGFYDATPEPEYVAVGDLVFIDKDENKVYNEGDSVLSGVKIELYELDKSVGTSNTEVFKTTITDANGQYQFDSLPVGEYVVYIPSSELDKSALKGLKLIEGVGDQVTDNDDNGTDELIDGGVASLVVDLRPDRMPTGERQIGYTGGLDDDNVNFTIDFGFYREKIDPEPVLMAIGDKVYLDVDGDGLYGAGDKGIEGVRVQLYTSDLSPGEDAPLSSAITDANGYYIFNNISPDTYILYIPSSEFEKGKPLYQKENVKNTVTTDPIDNDDNGQDNRLRGGIASLFITMQPKMAPKDEDQSNYKGELADENVDFTIDFGFYDATPEPEYVAVGNLVYLDKNEDGVYSDEDQGISDVRVELYGVGKTPGIDAPIDSTRTDAMGHYVFDSIASGIYMLYIPSEEFEKGRPLYSTKNIQNQVSADEVDNDDNGQNNKINGGIASLFISISPDNAPVNEDQSSYVGGLTDASVNYTIDFGFYAVDIPDPVDERVAVGNHVFVDKNKDGVFTEVDSSLSNVKLELYKATQSPGVDTPLDSTVTDENGYYIFDTLQAGTYVVHIPASQFVEGNFLNTCKSTFDYGSYIAIDNDDNGENTLVNGGVSSFIFRLKPNEEPTGERNQDSYKGELDDDNVNLTVDFGFFVETPKDTSTVDSLDFINFEVIKNNLDAELFWTVSSEPNNEKFEIQISRDGETFEVVDMVASKGKTTEQTNYTYPHIGIGASAQGEDLYYRIRQINTDGTFTYSPLRVISFDAEVRSFSIYPNPVTDELRVKVSPVCEDCRLLIYQTDGKVVLDKVYDGKPLQLSYLHQGLYILTIFENTGEINSVSKVVKL